MSSQIMGLRQSEIDLLDKLVNSKTIADYKVYEEDENGFKDKVSDSHNSQVLELYFYGGKTLKITAICPNYYQDASLCVEKIKE